MNFYFSCFHDNPRGVPQPKWRWGFQAFKSNICQASIQVRKIVSETVLTTMPVFRLKHHILLRNLKWMFTGLVPYLTVRLTMCSKTIFLITIPTWDSKLIFCSKFYSPTESYLNCKLISDSIEAQWKKVSKLSRVTSLMLSSTMLR